MNKVLFTLLLSCSATTSWCMENVAAAVVIVDNLMKKLVCVKLNASNPSDEDITMDTDSTPSPSHASSTSSSNQGSPRDDVNKKAVQRMSCVKTKKAAHPISRIINDEKSFQRAINDIRIQTTINDKINDTDEVHPPIEVKNKINNKDEVYPHNELQNIIGVVDYEGNIKPVYKDHYQKPALPLEQRLAIQAQAITYTLKPK